MKRKIQRLALPILSFALLCSCASNTTPSSSEEAELEEDFYTISPAQAGNISGTVIYEGEVPPSQKIDMSSEPECAKVHSAPILSQRLLVDETGGLANVFLAIEADFEGLRFKVPSEPVTIDQVGCTYTPLVLGVRTGQKLFVRNSDPVTHNVHPLPRFNRESNRTQSAGTEPLYLPFSRPEMMIPVKCNLHSWMVSFVSVMSHPFFAVSAADGSFEIQGLPPGEYTLVAMHERLGRQKVTVTVGPGESKSIEILYKQPER